MSKVINFADSQSEVERQETAERLARKQTTEQVEAQRNGSDNTVHHEPPKEKTHVLRKSLVEDIKTPFKIKKEFEKLIPPLADSEFDLLEKNILADGCREPLVVWNGILLDGHHRLSICLEHGLPFKTVPPREEIKENLDAKIWVFENQLGRRDLDDFVKSEMALELKKLYRERAERNSGDHSPFSQDVDQEELNKKLLRRHNYDSVEENILKTDKNNKEKHKKWNENRVDAQIANAAGVSRLQINRTEKILKKGDPEDIADLRAKKTTINKVFNKIKKKEHQETLAAHQLPEGKYRVLYVDPPWSLGSEPVASTKPDALGYYPRMTVEEIAEIPIQDICEKNAALFMWTPPELLPSAIDVLEHWGFEYRAIFTWKKDKATTGLYNKIDQEFLLVGEKGNCQPENDEIVSSIQCIDKKGASKPDEFRKIIENLYSSTKNKVELYPRKKCEGWSQYEH